MFKGWSAKFLERGEDERIRVGPASAWRAVLSSRPSSDASGVAGIGSSLRGALDVQAPDRPQRCDEAGSGRARVPRHADGPLAFSMAAEAPSSDLLASEPYGLWILALWANPSPEANECATGRFRQDRDLHLSGVNRPVVCASAAANEHDGV